MGVDVKALRAAEIKVLGLLKERGAAGMRAAEVGKLFPHPRNRLLRPEGAGKLGAGLLAILRVRGYASCPGFPHPHVITSAGLAALAAVEAEAKEPPK